VADGALHRVDVATGAVSLVAAVGGGANAAYPASDGGFVVTQNGGIDFSRSGIYSDDPPPYRPAMPGIQRVEPAGAVSYLLDEDAIDGGFLAPNDLVADATGTLWFTDPPPHPPPPEPVGRVHALDPDGTLRTVAVAFQYCNGIGLEPGGAVVVVEADGLMRLHDDGGKEWIVEHLPHGSGDGFCVDTEGRLYVASTRAHGVAVIEPDGREVEFLEIGGPGITTNCCFGGPDGRTLYATDGIPGQLVAWEGLPTPGLPVHPWPVP
ncbi:MAG TPA: SMP-30/gluconolactonase/LRE family protein, partial [Acidimicrobiia bacterium]|nr:SMP-30/gluconolactonase/LRE family protein [Acidimicrobiia bacterium]